MMPPWLHSKYLAVQHVRNPSERMPVAGLGSRESPADIIPGQAAQHMGIFSDINAIIVADEAIAKRREKRSRHENEQQKTNEDDSSLRKTWVRRGWL